MPEITIVEGKPRAERGAARRALRLTGQLRSERGARRPLGLGAALARAFARALARAVARAGAGTRGGRARRRASRGAARRRARPRGRSRRGEESAGSNGSKEGGREEGGVKGDGEARARRRKAAREESSEHAWMADLNATARAAGMGLAEYCRAVKQAPAQHSFEDWSLARRCLSALLRQWKRFHVRAINDARMEQLELAHGNVSRAQLLMFQVVRGFERKSLLAQEGLANPAALAWDARDTALYAAQKASPTGFVQNRTAALFDVYLAEGAPVTAGMVRGDPDPTFSSYDDMTTESDDKSEVTLADRREEEWRVKFASLKAFFDARGHTAVPKKHAEEPWLAAWVNTQKTRLRAGRMDASRAALLAEVGLTLEALSAPAGGKGGGGKRAGKAQRKRGAPGAKGGAAGAGAEAAADAADAGGADAAGAGRGGDGAAGGGRGAGGGALFRGARGGAEPRGSRGAPARGARGRGRPVARTAQGPAARPPRGRRAARGRCARRRCGRNGGARRGGGSQGEGGQWGAGGAVGDQWGAGGAVGDQWGGRWSRWRSGRRWSRWRSGRAK